MPKRERNNRGQFEKKHGSSESKPLFLRIGKSTSEFLKVTALEMDITVSDLVENLINAHLKGSPEIAKEVRPMISQAKFSENSPPKFRRIMTGDEQ